MPINDALDAFHNAVGAVIRAGEIEGFIGKLDPSNPSTPIIDVPGRTGYVYVRISNGNNTWSTTEAFNKGSNRNPNIKIRMVRRPTGLVIIDTDESTAVAVLGDRASGSSVPPHSHSIASGNPDMVEGMRFVPGVVRPATGEGELAGLYVVVEEFEYDGGLWPTSYFLMTVPSTSSMQAWCKIALNPATGTLTQYTGTEYGLSYPMSSVDASAITVPDTYYPLSAVVLYNGQTEITGREKWHDCRLHIAQVGGDITGFVSTAPDSDTRNTVQPSGDHPALILKNNGSQTDAPFQVQTSAGAVMAQVSSVGGLIVNEQGADADTRIEGDTDANLVFVDASTDRVGIGTNTPAAKFSVSGATSLDGAVTINDAGADVDTRIEGDTAANLVFVDASKDAVGINQATIANSAVLDIASTTKGMLIPRVTTTERDAISSPATGLLVYNTTTSAFNFYNGSSWAAVGGGGAGSLTVKEVDGTPTASAVDTIVVSNGTLTDDGGGQVTITIAGGSTPYSLCQGRLTLTSGTPVTTSDVTAATTIYFTPYKGNQIGLYSGSAWNLFTFSEISLSLSGYTASKPYDIWVYDSSGTPTLDSTVWTDDTTRATALTTQDGVYVKSGATTRRYLGTIRITGTTGQTEDSEAKRYVWNYYNRANRRMALIDTSPGNWTYNSSTYRQANNSSDYRVQGVWGVAEDVVVVTVAVVAGRTGSSTTAMISIAEDSTTTPSHSVVLADQQNTASGHYHTKRATLTKTPAAGFHYYQWMERVTLNTCEFYTDPSSAETYGINGVFIG